MLPIRLWAVIATIYLPLMFGADGAVVAIDGHGERMAVQRDFAVVTCANGAVPAAVTTDNMVIVRCDR